MTQSTFTDDALGLVVLHGRRPLDFPKNHNLILVAQPELLNC